MEEISYLIIEYVSGLKTIHNYAINEEFNIHIVINRSEYTYYREGEILMEYNNIITEHTNQFKLFVRTKKLNKLFKYNG